MTEFGRPEDLGLLLSAAQKCGASGFCLKPGRAPVFTIHQHKVSAKLPAFTSRDIEALAMKVIADEDRRTLEKFGSVVFAYEIPRVGRFRISIYQGNAGMLLTARALGNESAT